MPPTRTSRHKNTLGTYDDAGRLFLTNREPYRYRPLPDNELYHVVEGDTLFRIAGKKYRSLERGAGYWWAIADFQPEPIIDPTMKLEPGTVLVIPSARTLLEEILANRPQTP